MSRADEVVDRYLTPLIWSLVRFGQTEEDAREIAQEALWTLCQRLDRIAPGKERAYLWVTAYNLARDRAQQGPADMTPLENIAEPPDERPSAEATVIERQEIRRFREQFNAALATLSQDTRQCLVLRGRGYGSKQIAATLGLEDAAVRSRLSRAMNAIRKQVGEPPAGIEWFKLLGDDDDHER